MTIDKFPTFAKIVAASFQTVAGAPRVYVTAVDGDALYQRYLASFPDGANPVHRKQTEHECSCCRHFIRRAGNAVAVNDHGLIRTIWDEAAGIEPEIAPHPYDVVAGAMRDAVLAAEISDLYRVGLNENSFGAATTRSLGAGGEVVAWNHLHTGAIPGALRVASPDQARGDYHTTVQVFTRGLVELAPVALDTVLALIEANNLYRGAEHKEAVVQFMAAQRAFQAKEQRARHVFAWTHAAGPASRFRNTVIGTLVQDISDGVDVERAVASFEAKVAPTNYKRTTAVITPAMVREAMRTIEALGLEPALERRFAAISDVSVNDVKWVDGSVRPAMRGGLADALMQVAVTANPQSAKKDEDRAEDVGLDAFVEQVLPTATGVEILLRSSEHLGNLVSLTAPVHSEPRQLFRWNNDFAWSYGGNVTDSIAERVKKAGGRVEGAVLRISLSWFNYDDLDLHIYEPSSWLRSGGDHIYFGNKRGASGGTLDVDMNAGGGSTREAVENVVWVSRMPDGAYRVVVNNYSKRETTDVGFVIEVECAGRLSHYSYNKQVRNRLDVHVVTLHMKDGLIDRVEIGDPAITASNISQTKWGLTTEQYVRVDAVMLSPNYWGDNAVGNKHTFFVIRGARNDEPTRGIYNEFLHPRLEPHRKVFEVIGDKTKCQPTDGQLSGLGFSSTKRTSFLARVQQGKKQRLFNVHVGS